MWDFKRGIYILGNKITCKRWNEEVRGSETILYQKLQQYSKVEENVQTRQDILFLNRLWLPTKVNLNP